MDRLQGKRVLIVEDDWYLADVTAEALMEAGASIVGPVSSILGARRLLSKVGSVDMAVLDFNLGGQPVTELIEELADKGVKIVVITGYGESIVPQPTASKVLKVFSKPVSVATVVEVLSGSKNEN